MSTEALTFDPSDPSYLADPYPVFRRLRQESPLYWWEKGNTWLMSRYADVEATLKDPRFSVDIRNWRYYEERSATTLPSELLRLFEDGLFQVSRADHTRIRKLVMPSFNPRAVAQREGVMQEIVDELLADVDESEIFDLMPRLAEPMPIRVISRILGIPAEHDREFREWGQALVKLAFPVMPPDEYEALARTTPAGFDLLERVIEQRRADPGDDLLSSLLLAEEEGDRLRSSELVSLVGGLITAGSETTVHLLAFAVWELLRHPAVLQRVQDDLDLLPGVIEEVLRHDNFGSVGVARYALQDMELHGQTIRKGDMIMLLLGAAMHDETVWPDAERFDIDREPAPNLSFGRGAHFCLGAHLARGEARVALRTLLRRYPTMSLAGPPTFQPHPFIRNMDSLPLHLRPPAKA